MHHFNGRFYQVTWISRLQP